MIIQTREHSLLYEFLNTTRLRLEFRNMISAAAIAASITGIVASPFVAYRAKLELRDGLLAVAIAIVAAALFVVFAMRRSVRLAQVVDRLEIAPEDRDRMAAGAEFLGDDDPLKRLAVQETEQWINQDRQRLSKIKMSRWPFAAAVAILILILLWLLTPAFQPRMSNEQIALATTASNNLPSPAIGNTNSPTIIARPNPVGLTATATAASNSIGLQSSNPAQSTSHGGGNLPSNMPGRSSTPTPALHRTPSGKSPAHHPHEESTTSLPGGAGHSAGGVPFLKVATPILPPAPTLPVHAANARPTGSAKEREALANPTDIPTPEHAAPADVRFTDPGIDPVELESLPPGRRQLVIEYFRAMHDEATVAPTTQP